ncbi:MAG: response regulator transcription factor [Candidatus Limnocylindrales bacterium]
MSAAGPTLLLVEDDHATRHAVALYLEKRGHHVYQAADAQAALEEWEAHRADLVLLDLGLPDLDGIEVVRRIRREGTTPIIILSARGEERDKVAALEAGADDYLSKPFGMEELRARISAVLRRAAGPRADASGRLVIGLVSLDVARHEARVGDRVLDLTTREYELLKALLAQPGRVVTKQHLLRSVWGTAYAEEGHYLHVYVSRLRRKLAEADPSGAAGRIIVADPGVGYRVVDR